MNRSGVQWLYRELPGLVEAGLVDDATAARLRHHYGEAKPVPISKVALVALGIFGAMLVGAGVILVFAHNWDQIPRGMRTALSFLLLLIAQALLAFAMMRRADSRPWLETTAALLIMAIGSTIALIGQIYHLPSNMDGFLLTWLCLGLPLVYLCRSTAAALLGLVGLLFFAGYAQHGGGHALFYWPLFLFLLPFLLQTIRNAPDSPRAVLLTIALCIHTSIALGIVLEKALPGLWILCYATLYALLRMSGAGGACRDRATARVAWFAGTVGIMVLTLLFTYDAPWNEVGWNHYRRGDYHMLAVYQDYVLTVGLLSTYFFLLFMRRRQVWREDGIWLAFPIAALVCYFAASPSFALILFNVYALALGLLELTVGIRAASLRKFNTGLLILSLFATLRFFDTDMPLAFRGILFIVLGLVFLVGNAIMMRRKRAVQGENR